MFIVWDRLFGTFQAEQERVHYGTTTPLRSFNPLWANALNYFAIAKACFKARSWKERWFYCFGPPGWDPNTGRPTTVATVPPHYEKFSLSTSFALKVYVIVELSLLIAGASYLLLYESQLSDLERTMLGVWCFVTPVGLCGLFHRARWANLIEVARHVFLGVVIVFLFA